MRHLFIFSKATWLGQGSLQYTQAELLSFHTRWEFAELSPGIYQAKHKVEIEGSNAPHENVYTFFPLDDKSFRVILQNPIVERAEGVGFIEEERIGWAIETPELQGREVFTKIDDATYSLEADYFSQEITSKIRGKIWKKFQS